MNTLKVITTNEGKFTEFGSALADIGLNLERVNIAYPEIQADTLGEVVTFGMQWLNRKLSKPYVIDDSGLFIGGLGGFPGVYSSYAYRTLGNAGILALMDATGDRSAVFRTVIGLSSDKGHFLFEGECAGSITREQTGTRGFGFDPIFKPSGSAMTFGQMATGEKNAVSHRGAALKKLKDALKS